MKIYNSHSYEQTINIGRRLAEELPSGSIVAYLGGMGMGKTAFTRGIAEGLGIDADVSSPTFAICNSYTGGGNTLHHFDMYRVDGWDDLYSTGFFDFLDTGAYIAVEWSENIFNALPDDAVIVEISKTGENSRQIKIYEKREEE